MDDSRKRPLRGLLAEDADGVILGLAHMDDGRQARFPRRRQMVAETRLLDPAVAVHVMKIESGLAKGHHLGMAGQFQQPCRRGDFDFLVGFMGVNAHTAPDIVMVLGDTAHALETVEPGGNGEHGPHPGMTGALNHRFHVLHKTGKIQVAMAVHQKGGAHFSPSSSST